MTPCLHVDTIIIHDLQVVLSVLSTYLFLPRRLILHSNLISTTLKPYLLAVFYFAGGIQRTPSRLSGNAASHLSGHKRSLFLWNCHSSP